MPLLIPDISILKLMVMIELSGDDGILNYFDIPMNGRPSTRTVGVAITLGYCSTADGVAYMEKHGSSPQDVWMLKATFRGVWTAYLHKNGRLGDNSWMMARMGSK